jgi:hypothetical protein
MNRAFSLLFFLIFLVITGCASSAGAGKESARTKAVEDLSDYRPKYPTEDAEAPVARLEPTSHVNDKVEVLLDTVANVNKSIKYARGYRILAYNGSEREKVMNLRKSLLRRVPEEKDYLTYRQPNFRLMIGDYFSRIEAQQVLNQLSDIIPNALIVADQINIQKSAR